MELGELVSEYRKREKLTIDELVKKSGVPKGTLNKIINGVTKSPSIEAMKSIAKALNCTLEDFDDSQKADAVSQEEIEFLKKYRAIDLHGKSVVDMILLAEYERCREGGKHIATDPEQEKIDRQLASYRTELEAEQKGVGAWSASPDAKEA